MVCYRVPRRFLYALEGCLGLLVSVGFRALFEMVMVDVTGDVTEGKAEGLFSTCPVHTIYQNDSTRHQHFNISVQFTQYMNTAYFVGVVVTTIPSGYLAQHFSTARLFGISICGSSVFLLLIPALLQYTYPWVVLVVRLIQGLLEGAQLPALNGVLSAWALKHEKGRILTFCYAGAYLSPAVAMFVSGVTSCFLSWNASLYIYGGCGIIWSVVWFATAYDHPSDCIDQLTVTEKSQYTTLHGRHASVKTKKSIPWKSILTSLPVYAIFFASFSRNWIFTLMVVGIQQYFEDVFKLNIADIGLMAALPEVAMTVFVVIGGVLTDKLIQHNCLSTTNTRKFANCTGYGVQGLCVIVIAAHTDKILAFTMMCVGMGISGLAISGYSANCLDLAPAYTSIITSFSRLGSLGSILSSTVIAVVRGHNASIERWNVVLYTAAAILLACSLFYGLFASGEEQSWARTDGTEQEVLLHPGEDNSVGENAPDLLRETEKPRNKDWFMESI